MTARRLIGWLLGVAATGYFVVFAWRSATQADLRALASGRMIGAVVLAAFAYASIIPTSSWAWQRLLRATGTKGSLLRLNVIMGISQIAKYLPGNFGHHVGRLAMSVDRGIPGGVVLVTVAAETLLAVAAAAMVGTLGLALASGATPALPGARLPSPATVLLVGAAVAAGALAAAAATRSSLLQRWLAPRLPLAPSTQGLARRALAWAFAAYVLNYLVIGLGLLAIARAAVPLPASTAPLFAGAFALAWVAGFVVPGAPAGLGVREGALATLLTAVIDPARTLEVVAAFRLATTLGDLIALAWGSSLRLLERRTAAVDRTGALTEQNHAS